MFDEETIRDIALTELQDANKKHPLFSSQHEAYAVTLEEYEETLKELECVKLALDRVWVYVKTDASAKALGKAYKDLGVCANRLVAEAIQVYAMAIKGERFCKVLVSESEPADEARR